ncbi:GNAT family N-acetyltransferase [Paraburkholderia sp. BL21I4N1]|uniref:GNAT family N-acetyltransferase n=1 Tax=Paraburkholderia sp. BL21I4N1 TaxID=1938801 RepID=UPI000CFBF4AB|nr:GNAT family N-acetyltransferase [Paraburkholderia sp. BL21I4N1]PQV51854.1 acetyltransferase (GNAT) family protein [Paraburkholderia sp. BL21I4N1]
MITAIRPCAFDDLANAASFDALCAEYAAESGRIPGLGQANVDATAYRTMEAAGVGQCIGAWHGDDLVGFGVVTLSVLPHYSKLIGCLISFFVAADARKGGVGTYIREVAEQIAQERGAIGLMISAPDESRLDVILPRSGYHATNRLYFKALP